MKTMLMFSFSCSSLGGAAWLCLFPFPGPLSALLTPPVPLSVRLGDGCFLSTLARSGVLEEDIEEEEEEGASLTRGCSCDLGVDRPEEELDTESVFSSEAVVGGVDEAGFSRCEEGTSDGGWGAGPASSMSSQDST